MELLHRLEEQRGVDKNEVEIKPERANSTKKRCWKLDIGRNKSSLSWSLKPKVFSKEAGWRTHRAG